VLAGLVLVTLRGGQRFDWTLWLFPFVGGAVILVGMYYGSKPQSLKADALKISVLDGFDTKRMLRSNLAFIFRGQLIRPVKYDAFWDKSYIFTGSDGTVLLQPWAEHFTDDGVVEFARQLGVPIRGDFSVKVKDRVDSALLS
jgi:hypothetical protein